MADMYVSAKEFAEKHTKFMEAGAKLGVARAKLQGAVLTPPDPAPEGPAVRVDEAAWKKMDTDIAELEAELGKVTAAVQKEQQPAAPAGPPSQR
jgi:hypothetical protein